MSEHVKRAILAQYRATHRGEPWYGSSREWHLRDVTARQAAATPLAGAPSIWAVVLHMTAWTEEVERRLAGGAPAAPERGDWSPVVRPGESAWRAAKASLTRAHRSLAEAIEALPPRRFSATIGTMASGADTNPCTVTQMLIGLLQHDAFHLGQIAALKKALHGIAKTR